MSVLKGKKIKKVTHRDYSILLALYRYRAFSTAQMHHLFFGESSSRAYCWNRLSFLKHDGYIEGTPIMGMGNDYYKKISTAYYITSKGIRLLQEKNMIEEVPRKADDNKIQPRRLPYHIDAMQVYTELCKLTFLMWESRQTKLFFNLDRNTYISGYLINPDNQGSGLYVISRDPTSRTLSYIATELMRFNDIKHNLILCRTEEGYRSLNQIIKRDGYKYHNDVSLMPFDIGIELLKKIGSKAGLEKLYKQYGFLVPATDVEDSPFAYLSRKNHEDRYICQLLSNSFKTRQSIFAYNPYEFNTHQRRLVVLAWMDDVEILNMELCDYPHIEVVGVLPEKMFRDERN